MEEYEPLRMQSGLRYYCALVLSLDVPSRPADRFFAERLIPGLEPLRSYDNQYDVRRMHCSCTSLGQVTPKRWDVSRKMRTFKGFEGSLNAPLTMRSSNAARSASSSRR